MSKNNIVQSWIASALLICTSFFLVACGGGGGSGNSHSSADLASSPAVSTSSSSSSSSSVASSKPSWFPVGVANKLPQLEITTENAVPIESKEVYIKGSYKLTPTSGDTTTQGTMEIRGRGNSTWDWPKKPYRLKLTNSTSILGMPANKNWVLLANFVDKTLIRNDIAFTFARELGMSYAPRSEQVEVTLNGVYKGVYQLAEHVRVAADRVSINEMKVTDTDEVAITGGYLLEIDFHHQKNICANAAFWSFCSNGVNTMLNVDYCIESKNGVEPYCLQSPDTLLDSAWSAQKEYITKYIGDMELALFGSDFKDPAKGYAAYLDVDSVINYYIVNELLKNVDGATSSFYLYKKRSGKLFFGPVWDFDLAIGNAGYNDMEKTYGWHIRKSQPFARLFDDPAFELKVKQRWAQLQQQGKISQLLDYAEARVTWFGTMQAKNYQVWSITEVAPWVLHTSLGTYELETGELLRWERERAKWMDTQLKL